MRQRGGRIEQPDIASTSPSPWALRPGLRAAAVCELQLSAEFGLRIGSWNSAIQHLPLPDKSTPALRNARNRVNQFDAWPINRPRRETTYPKTNRWATDSGEFGLLSR